MEKEKLKKLSLNLTSDRNDYMSSFRHNIDMYMAEKDITMRELSEAADISYSTLNTFVYGTSKDCNLSTAVKLARALGVTIDELVGAETIEPETRECVALARNLKDHHRYVIRSFVRHQYKLHGAVPPTSKQISVLLPECQHGYLKTTNVSEALNIDHLQSVIRTKACLGLRVPCEHYEPYFMQNEIILLAADRDGLNNERCVICQGGNLYICIKRIEFVSGQKKVKYLSLMDGKNVLFHYDEIDDKIGYVLGYLNPDGSWGIR